MAPIWSFDALIVAEHSNLLDKAWLDSGFCFKGMNDETRCMWKRMGDKDEDPNQKKTILEWNLIIVRAVVTLSVMMDGLGDLEVCICFRCNVLLTIIRVTVSGRML